jgi:hypothetical protein
MTLEKEAKRIGDLAQHHRLTTRMPQLIEDVVLEALREADRRGAEREWGRREGWVRGIDHGPGPDYSVETTVEDGVIVGIKIVQGGHEVR